MIDTNACQLLTDPAVLTVERFAALPPEWPHYMDAIRGDVLLARIHPKHNRPQGDEENVAWLTHA